MECKCGNSVTDRDHEVKTLRGLKNWTDIPFRKSLSPYRVWQKECDKCSRLVFIKVYDKNGTLLC